MTRLLLVRHCASSSDFPDSPLTDIGFRQAESLVSFLTSFDIDFIVSSPYLRALQTIAPFAQHQAIEVHQDARLQERELSTGPLPDWLDHLERSFTDIDYRLPTGESGREAGQRAWQAIDEIVEANHRCPALVAHGNLISLILGRLDPSIDFEFWRGLSNPDVYVLDRDRDAAWTSKTRLEARRLGVCAVERRLRCADDDREEFKEFALTHPDPFQALAPARDNRPRQLP